MGSSPFQALELEKTTIFQWLSPNFDGFELNFDKKTHDLKSQPQNRSTLVSSAKSIDFFRSKSLDLQARPLGHNPTVVAPSLNFNRT